MKRLIGILAAAAVFCLAQVTPSAAQVFVVQNCGTVPASMKVLSAGNPGMFFTDTTGVLCTSAGGGGGGLSVVDSAAWTTAVSPFTPGGGVFNDAATLSSGQQGTYRLTTKRGQIVDVDSSGNQLHSDLTAPPNLLVNGANGVWSGLTPGSAQTGTIVAANTDLSSIKGTAVSTGTGAQGTGTQRVTVATDQATNAGAALVKGGVGTVNGGSTYQVVAASATATVLQTSTGAIGDYLSHCVIQPETTSPGVVTVFDNANAAATNVISFPGGASSVSNLTPISVPVGAISTAGAWKVTTTTNVHVACFGKFS